MDRLAEIRRSKGLSQRALAEKSGVSPATVYELEKGRREPNPSTLKKLADALEVEVTDLMRETVKEEVEVGGLTDDGRIHREMLRFAGESIDSYEEHSTQVELFECPDGYRVHVYDGSRPWADLYPRKWDDFQDEWEYTTYSAEQVAEIWPTFGDAVGVLRVRDID